MSDETTGVKTPEQIKKEKRKKKNKYYKNLLVIMFFVFIVGAIIGYICGYPQGLFDGYQLCLKQFNMIRYVPSLVQIP